VRSRLSLLSRIAALSAATMLVLAMPQPSIAQSGPDGWAGGQGSELTPLIPVPPAESGLTLDGSTDRWFVELSSPPAAQGASRSALAQERSAFRAEAAQAGVSHEELRTFDTLFNGLSVRINPDDVRALASLQSVKAVYPVEEIPLPETSDITPQLSTALGMTGADIAQNELGLTGEGLKVAVMDTGIDYTHPDLGGCFGPFSPGQDCRVIAGFDFVGDSFNAGGTPEQQIPQPNDDPMDCNSHGTHVAGIVGADPAAEGGALGVAPGVTFGAYKVFGCAGSTFADIMIDAMEMALADGMDILNMSIGAAFTWPQYPTAVASDLLVDQGMVVVASIGNSGASGVYSAGAPGLGEKVIGVASFDNSHINALTFDVNPSGQKVPYLGLSVTPDAPTAGESDEVVFVGRGCLTPDAGANPPIPPGGDPYLDDPAGKVALIVRGDCTFQEKYQRAADAGATAVVIHNQLSGLFAGGGITPRDIPGVGISDIDGLHIRDLLAAGETVTLSWTDERVDAPNPAGGLISSFSSYGLAPDLTLKPDIGAPGGLIRSTIPVNQGSYGTSSGTSMSAPHVAGAVALLLEARPDIPAGNVRDVLQNTADPKPWWGNPGLGFLDNVHRQGAGMVNIPAAVESTTAVTPGKLSLGASAAGPATRKLQIRNNSSEPVTYTFGNTTALATGGSTFAPGFFLANAVAAFETSEVTVAAGHFANVHVTITAPAAPNLGQYGGYLEVHGSDGSLSRVPYAGFIGNYQDIQALVPTQFGFPLIALEVEEGVYSPLPEGGTFTLTDGDMPNILVHLSHQVQEFRVLVRDANTDRNWHRAFDIDIHPRSSGPTAFFAYEWDGTTTNPSGKEFFVPNGTYILELSVLKALGDRDNPDHWEHWTSPPVTLDRP
jgi:minor extracellular serine protease Vpr